MSGDSWVNERVFEVALEVSTANAVDSDIPITMTGPE